MAAKPPVRKRKSTDSLVAQAAAGEETTTRPADAPEYRNWNVRLPADLVERVWGTCQALDDAEDLPSAVAFTVRAFEELLDRLDAEHHDGKPFHANASPFRAGGRTTYKR